MEIIMDISKELLQLNNNKDELKNILEKFRKEQIIAEQKNHIFNVINLAGEIKELAPVLIEAGCDVILMINCDGRRNYSIELAPRNNEDRLAVRDKKQNFLPWFRQLLDITPDFKINNEYTNDFTQQKIYLNSNLEEQIYDTLLSKELKAILDYNQLNLQINNMDNKVQKAHKV